jgi:hypothetical protein
MTTKPDHAAIIRALAAAAQVAGLAPSFHNSQPWHWRIRGQTADLYADPARHLRVNDPDRRMLMISCGAALQHMQVALAAEGLSIDLTAMPEAASPDHLARLEVTGAIPATPESMRLVQTIEIRRTDRRPVADQPMPGGTLDELRKAAARYGVGLDPLDREQTIELASATARAQRDEISDKAAKAELDAWTGLGRPPSAGVPDANIPAHGTQTTVPSRDFGHVGKLGVSYAHDNSATYAILYGVDDEPGSWLQAGQALAELWLTAVERGVAVLPLSAAVEEPDTRLQLSEILSGVGYPYLAVRLGMPDMTRSMPAHTPRLKPEVTIEVAD